jgi:predicted nucleic acid-binding protein
MGLIIDTSALVEIERSDLGFEEALESFINESVGIPVIVWAELLTGVRLAKSARIAANRRARLEQLRLYVPIIEFDPDIAEHYADIFAECVKSGKMIPQNEMAVAATARKMQYGVLVGSKDEAHFRLVKKLSVVCLNPLSRSAKATGNE